jgi:hypothetical protein
VLTAGAHGDRPGARAAAASPLRVPAWHLFRTSLCWRTSSRRPSTWRARARQAARAPARCSARRYRGPRPRAPPRAVGRRAATPPSRALALAEALPWAAPSRDPERVAGWSLLRASAPTAWPC